MKQHMRIALVTAACAICIAAVLAYKGYDMGILNRLPGNRDSASEQREDRSINLAFILLTEAHLPDAEAIAQAFREFAAPGESVQVRSDDSGEHASKEVVFLEHSTGELSFIALLPVPVPNAEADHGAQFSLSSFRSGWKLPSHSAHLLVTISAEPKSQPILLLSRFTSLLAAVTRVSPAVGVYWGGAGATHDSEFFTSVATDQDVVPRIMLWSGVSIGRESDGRLSLLSLGMNQLHLPDLLLVAGKSSESDAVTMMFDLLAYVAERGEALREGETVGRTADERLSIRYVPSPVDPAKQVWRVELP